MIRITITHVRTSPDGSTTTHPWQAGGSTTLTIAAPR